ncbi:hypothetical protein AXF42_Ash006118 [Apostasia shenzhenica]|uniref:SWIM-type domain-containing protein n=1 Tax=Apostasia shenzhenica TaxID=1088818 RepID=A0A2I0B098_9ASPA|nr:hypothetical protein AXF42_Ash006118 [Apostasia shenzhenica]
MCTCIEWQITGLPCVHAAAFITSLDLPLWHTYVDDYYHVYRYECIFLYNINIIILI